VDYLAKADALNYENVINGTELIREVMAKGIQHKSSSYEFKNHNFFTLDDFNFPDFGATISKVIPSYDCEYFALVLKGADSKSYITTIDKNGKKLYEPFVDDDGLKNTIVCNGYIIYSVTDTMIKVIAPDGKTFYLGDGTALTGIGKDCVVRSSTVTSSDYGVISISDGYITSKGSLYKLDGTEVKTIQMAE
jgi:hypothetical protein